MTCNITLKYIQALNNIPNHYAKFAIKILEIHCFWLNIINVWSLASSSVFSYCDVTKWIFWSKHIYLWCWGREHVLRLPKLHPSCIFKNHLQTPFSAPVTSQNGYIGPKHIYLWCRGRGHVLRPQKLHCSCILKNHLRTPFSAPVTSQNGYTPVTSQNGYIGPKLGVHQYWFRPELLFLVPVPAAGTFQVGPGSSGRNRNWCVGEISKQTSAQNWGEGAVSPP